MPLTEEGKLRRITFRPYAPGMGPAFTLTTWDAEACSAGKWLVGYRLTVREGGRRAALFEGEDFGCAPGHAIDSDAACEGVMAFLTLRPGDIDPEYFDGYTKAQMDYCREHAEALADEVLARFGERPDPAARR